MRSHSGAFEQGWVSIEGQLVDFVRAAYSFDCLPTVLRVDCPIRDALMLDTCLTWLDAVGGYGLLVRVQAFNHSVLVGLFFSLEVRSVAIIFPIVWVVYIGLVILNFFIFQKLAPTLFNLLHRQLIFWNQHFLVNLLRNNLFSILYVILYSFFDLASVKYFLEIFDLLAFW